MQPSFWLNKWKIGDIAFHQDEINYHLIQYFFTMNLKAGDTLLVPFCGKSQDLCWLHEQNLNIIGIELSDIACRDFFAEMGVCPDIKPYKNFTLYQFQNIKILCGNFFNLLPGDLPNIQGVYDCKALIALPAELREKYSRHLLKCVGNNIGIFLVNIDTKDSVVGPPFPVHFSEINLLYGDNFKIDVLQTRYIKSLPENLIAAGFTEITENIILLTSLK